MKILHTLSASGLIGGLGCHMLLLVYAPQDTPAAYADMRQSIAMISNYVLLPSLGVVLASGLLAIAVHTAFQPLRWVWFKAAMGLLMFKGVLTLVGAMSDTAADLARKIEGGTQAASALQKAIAYEWSMLWVIMALSVLNVVLGVWRPRLASSAHSKRGSSRTA
ncbi:MAG: hypothetical protein AAGF81_09155 [Pseudomonadota bacterium]